MTGASTHADDIVVTAFTPRYLAAYKPVAITEGGFADDRRDRGGATNFGVSLRFLVSEGRIDLDGDGFADFDLDMDGDIDVADIRALKPIDAQYLFQRCFWNRLQCETWPAPIGEALFDQAVNGGCKAAARLLQRAINRCLNRRVGYHGRPAGLREDGDLGPRTRAAFDWVLRLPAAGMPELIDAYREMAKVRYRNIVAADPTQGRFLTGWLARADRLGRA